VAHKFLSMVASAAIASSLLTWPLCVPASAGDAPGVPPAQAVALPSQAGHGEAAVASRGHLNPGFFAAMAIPSVAYSEASGLVQSGKVTEILARSGSHLVLFLRTDDGRVLQTMPPGDKMDPAILSAHADIWADGGDLLSVISDRSAGSLNILLTVFLLVWLGRKMTKNPGKLAKPSGIGEVTFADVAGQDEAKEELLEIVEFLKDPSKFASLGARVPRGVLLEGNPGNGKTLLAKAVAGEASVPFFHIAGPEFLEMFAGLGARRVRGLFKAARGARRPFRWLQPRTWFVRCPAIIFIDEIDAIGGKRGNGGGSDVQGEREQILTQLLTELDGLAKRGKIVLICATNRADSLDPALLRPGRLDRRVFVPGPDLGGRTKILAVHARKVPLAEDVDLEMVARLMPGSSGADLANLVNEAAIFAGRWGLAAVALKCFQAARDKALLGPERRSGVMDDDMRRLVAWHESGHTLVAFATPHSDPINKVTIIPRGRAMGFLSQVPETDQHMLSRAKLNDMLAVAMAGRAAEALMSGDEMISTGAEADIDSATRYARMMVTRWGMSPAIGRMACVGQEGQPIASPVTMARVDHEVQAVIDAAYDRALGILESMRPSLDALANRLLDVETMSGADVAALVHATADSDRIAA